MATCFRCKYQCDVSEVPNDGVCPNCRRSAMSFELFDPSSPLWSLFPSRFKVGTRVNVPAFRAKTFNRLGKIVGIERADIGYPRWIVALDVPWEGMDELYVRDGELFATEG